MTLQEIQTDKECTSSDEQDQTTDCDDTTTDDSSTDCTYLSTIKNGGKKTYDFVSDRVVRGAKATNTIVHKHPYVGVAVGAGAGALFGVLISRLFKRSSK